MGVKLGNGRRVAFISKHVPLVPLALEGVWGHAIDQVVLQTHVWHVFQLLLGRATRVHVGVLVGLGRLDLGPER